MKSDGMAAAVRVLKRLPSCWLMLLSIMVSMFRASRNTVLKEWEAPITAYNRLSRNPIRVHSNIYEPDYVVVVDESLIESVDVTAGTKEGGAIIINSHKSSNELKPLLEEKGYHGHIYTIDARKISIETLGKYFPNSPMLAAVVKITGVMEEKAFLEDMRKSYAHKFASKPSVIDGNMKALEIALKEVH